MFGVLLLCDASGCRRTEDIGIQACRLRVSCFCAPVVELGHCSPDQLSVLSMLGMDDGGYRFGNGWDYHFTGEIAHFPDSFGF
jgi:hypothetical protein